MQPASSSPVESDVTTVDVIVLGGGPAGENVAQYAVEGGLSALVVERELMGGECSYYACMPSKALLRPLEILDTSKHLGGLNAGSLDRDGLLARRDSWVSGYDDSGQVDWARGAGIEVLRGVGRLADERLVTVEGSDGPVRVEARVAVVIATGSVPVVPQLFAELQPWGSRDATGVVEVPERLLIVGGGVVAVETATWMSALGSTVTLLARGELLGSAEPVAGELVGAALTRRGVRVVVGVEVESADREAASATGLGRLHGGEVTVVAGGKTYRADEVMVATGRRPRLDGIGLDAVGLTPDDLRDGRRPDWLHVIGDAGSGAPLTHMGKYEARALGSRLAGVKEHIPAQVPTPQVVFTDPQVASVGLTEQAARQAGHDVVVSQVPFTAAAGTSLLRDDADGQAKLVVDRASGVLLGATFVGPQAGDLIHAATVAIVGQVPVSVLRHAVPAYPTASELWLRLLETLPRELR